MRNPRARTAWQLNLVLNYHLVFTVPDALNPWVQLCPRVLYTQLFASA